MRAAPNQYKRHRRIAQILAPNLRHDVIGIITVDEVVVTERSQRLWRENTLNLGPLKNEIINFLFVAVVKGRNENVAFYWWGRRLQAIKCGQGHQIVAVVRHCAFLRLAVGRASWIAQAGTANRSKYGQDTTSHYKRTPWH